MKNIPFGGLTLPLEIKRINSFGVCIHSTGAVDWFLEFATCWNHLEVILELSWGCLNGLLAITGEKQNLWVILGNWLEHGEAPCVLPPYEMAPEGNQAVELLMVLVRSKRAWDVRK